MKLLAPIALASLALAATSPANAAEPRSGHIDGYTVSIIESGSWDAPDFITIYGPAGKEQLTVTCAPFKWNSYGANTEEFVNAIARSWCF